MRIVLDTKTIKELLPHRFPFLYVDRIIELEPRKRAVGVKCFTITEHILAGHFQDEPIVPGVLIIEAIAQVAALAIAENRARTSGKLVKVDRFKFLKPVVNGDQM